MTDLLKVSGGLMSVGELSSLLDLLSSVLLLPPSLSAFWLSESDAPSALNTPAELQSAVDQRRWLSMDPSTACHWGARDRPGAQAN